MFRSSKQVKSKDFEKDARQCVMESLKDLYTSGDEEEGTYVSVHSVCPLVTYNQGYPQVEQQNYVSLCHQHLNLFIIFQPHQRHFVLCHVALLRTISLGRTLATNAILFLLDTELYIYVYLNYKVHFVSC